MVQEAIVVIKDIFRKYPNKYVPAPASEGDVGLLGLGMVEKKSKEEPLLFLPFLPQTALSKERLFFLTSPEQPRLCSPDQNKN